MNTLDLETYIAAGIILLIVCTINGTLAIWYRSAAVSLVAALTLFAVVVGYGMYHRLLGTPTAPDFGREFIVLSATDGGGYIYLYGVHPTDDFPMSYQLDDTEANRRLLEEIETRRGRGQMVGGVFREGAQESDNFELYDNPMQKIHPKT